MKKLFFVPSLTAISFSLFGCTDTYTTETEIRQPTQISADVLVDDTIGSDLPVFDSTMSIDGKINNSAAVFRLDAPGYDNTKEAELGTLYASPAQAAAAVNRFEVLPSINLVEAKAKQFNDGLYAAIDKAYFDGINEVLYSHKKLLHDIYDNLTDTQAISLVAAGLLLAGDTVPAQNASYYLNLFNESQILSKPIGFYTWNNELEKLFRCMRFFQQEFPWGPIPSAIVSALMADSLLTKRALATDKFFSKLTNPLSCISMSEIASLGGVTSQSDLERIAQSRGYPNTHGIALFPPSTSVEIELFNAIFPGGIPPNANLMNALITAIQSGTVDLTPKDETGWYGRQVWALQTLLLPSKGEEGKKLLLTSAYKKRLIDAFKAMITIQRETHVRQSGTVTGNSADIIKIVPRFRVEPGCTYFLRTSLAYAFLQEFLNSTVGLSVLSRYSGMNSTGARSQTIAAELEYMRSLFHGLYLVSAEDIGMKATKSPVGWNATTDKKAAEQWLGSWESDPDMSVDTRVAVPLGYDVTSNTTKLWATIGFRFCHFTANYVVPPHVRYGSEVWQKADIHECDTARYVLPVMEFTEISLKGNKVLTRKELQDICTANATKEMIIKRLNNY